MGEDVQLDLGMCKDGWKGAIGLGTWKNLKKESCDLVEKWKRVEGKIQAVVGARARKQQWDQ